MITLLGDFNAKLGSEGIFKQTIGNESLHGISNDNGVRLVNTATSKNLRVKSTIFPHHSIHKYTWTSPDGKTHNQIEHIFIDKGRRSNVIEVRSLRAADCDTDHYLVVAKFRERLAVNKQRSLRRGKSGLADSLSGNPLRTKSLKEGAGGGSLEQHYRENQATGKAMKSITYVTSIAPREEELAACI
jgi:hypothetical protein